MNSLTRTLSGLDRGYKRAIMMGYDGGAMLVALWLAFSLRLSYFYVPRDELIVALGFGAAALGLIALSLLGIYRVVIRYLDVGAASRLALGAAASASVWFMLAFVSRLAGLPRSVGFIYFGLLFLFMFFGRLVASQLLTGNALHSPRGDAEPAAKGVGVVIHGANAAGFSLAESIRRDPRYKLRFFVDDSKALIGRMMMGFPIKPSSSLRKEVEAGRVEQVFLAMPSATRTERLAALSTLSGLAVRVMTVPSYEEIMSGRYTLSDVRPVKVDDLLKRDIVPPLKHLIEDGIRGKSILVTGAGGSIGSEICRQVAHHEPERLVLLDHSEFALFAIETELRRLYADGERQPPEIVPVIGSLLNARLVGDILKRRAIDTVFHAAAYKHVPLLEDNEVVGVENNVVGTRILADACIAARVERLTMISTDKAVRPTNVMGSSKRVAELYIQALAHEPGMPTCFGIVRFGNVLDSSGSVVQEFRKQIENGGPVTVTHADITRFFMSIPEATQLVLQANALATGGEVFVLDMGEPVRIADLARTMIALSGMAERTLANPHGDIEITYVGLRPGEKLHEELFIGEEIADTVHPQIKMARERSIPMGELNATLARLEAALEQHDPEAVRKILSGLLELDHRLAA